MLWWRPEVEATGGVVKPMVPGDVVGLIGWKGLDEREQDLKLRRLTGSSKSNENSQLQKQKWLWFFQKGVWQVRLDALACCDIQVTWSPTIKVFGCLLVHWFIGYHEFPLIFLFNFRKPGVIFRVLQPLVFNSLGLLSGFSTDLEWGLGCVKRGQHLATSTRVGNEQVSIKFKTCWRGFVDGRNPKQAPGM